MAKLEYKTVCFDYNFRNIDNIGCGRFNKMFQAELNNHANAGWKLHSYNTTDNFVSIVFYREITIN